MAAGTFIVGGRRIRCGSERRYIVVRLDVARGNGIERRSDSRATALAEEHRLIGRGVRAVTIDTTTGEEIR